VTDRPRLIGWSSLHLAHHRSLTPFVISVGTVLSVPEPRGSWRSACLATNASRLPTLTKTPAPGTLAEPWSNDQDAFRRVTLGQVAPTASLARSHG